jgi:hypothetical protein
MESIDIYKPTATLQEIFDFNESLPDNELVFVLLKKFVVARKLQDATFLVMGRMLKIIRDRKLYKYLDFEDFSQFLASEEISFSREKAYMYILICERFVDELGLEQEDMIKMGVARLKMLAPVVKGMEKQKAIKLIDDSKDLRYNDFIRSVKTEANKNGKPNVFWSEETKKYIVQYFENTTHLISLGNWENGNTEEGKEIN